MPYLTLLNENKQKTKSILLTFQTENKTDPWTLGPSVGPARSALILARGLRSLQDIYVHNFFGRMVVGTIDQA